MNNVCTHIVRLDMTYKKLRYYTGNYDMYVKLRRDQDMVQMRQYEAEQRDIAEIKDFIARFGHGTAKMVRQAQAREKLLEKKLEAGLTPKPEVDPHWDWSFPDAWFLNCKHKCWSCLDPKCQKCALPKGYCDNLPAEFEFDFIRVYQAVDDPKQTLGC